MSAGPRPGEGDPPVPVHRPGRQRRLLAFLRVVTALVFVLGVVAVVAPPEVAEPVGWAMVAGLVAAPLGRVVWLVARWRRRGDRPFVLVAMALLAVVGVAGLLAL